MFTIKNLETGKNKLTILSKTTIIVIGVITAVVAAVINMEDRYLNTAVAKEMYIKIEKDAVDTFQMMQKTIDTKQQALKRHLKMKDLEDLRHHRLLLQNDLKENPNDMRARDMLNRVTRRIINIENELFQ